MLSPETLPEGRQKICQFTQKCHRCGNKAIRKLLSRKHNTSVCSVGYSIFSATMTPICIKFSRIMPLPYQWRYLLPYWVKDAGSKRASGGPFLASRHQFLPLDHKYLETISCSGHQHHHAVTTKTCSADTVFITSSLRTLNSSTLLLFTQKKLLTVL